MTASRLALLPLAFAALLSLAACGGGKGGEAAVVLTACNPVTQTGCSAGKKCAWIRTSSGATATGALACVPDGTVAESGACHYGADGAATGYDDCRKGLICKAAQISGATGTCSDICDTAAGTGCANAATQTCAAFSGFFANGSDSPPAGLCEAQCNPLTQVRLTDGALACGSPDPGNPTLGCYGLPSNDARPTTFICAPAGPAANVSDVSVGTSPFLNSCAPGFIALLFSGSGATDVICTAYCAPAPTTLESHPNPGGLSPHSCADAGAGGTHECRYLGSLEGATTPQSQWSTTLGYCFDYTRYGYTPPGGVTTPDPSCTTLSGSGHAFDPILSDAAAWACTLP